MSYGKGVARRLDRGHNGRCSQGLSGDRGDDLGQALRCYVRRLLLPSSGPLRTPREHHLPDVQGGDVIVEAAGRPVLTPGGLVAAIGTLSPGEKVTLGLRRSGKTIERTVRTVPAPDDDERAIIGIQISQDARIRLPRKVNIDLGNVGGASAGLPFALEVYQQLGRDVDRGYRVAATGEIQLDGSVAPVGGIKQKTVGVRRSGADVFLVPAGENASTARRYAGTLRIVPVESFRQALHVLQTLPPK